MYVQILYIQKQIHNEVSEEVCDLIPNKLCQVINVMVPYIDYEETCKDVTHEICELQRNNPRTETVEVMVKKCNKTPKVQINGTADVKF